MAHEHLEEVELASEDVFSGHLLKVKKDKVRLPDGAESYREYIVHPGAVAIVAVLDNGNLLLERQYRYPLHQAFLELPAGKIDPGEDTLSTGKRELEEETGYLADEWRFLGLIHPCIGYSNERIEFFLAQGLKHVGHARDEGEFLDVLELSPQEALAAVMDGRITDGKTIAGLFFARQILGG